LKAWQKFQGTSDGRFLITWEIQKSTSKKEKLAEDRLRDHELKGNSVKQYFDNKNIFFERRSAPKKTKIKS
jgi:hypothetical protein